MMTTNRCPGVFEVSFTTARDAGDVALDTLGVLAAVGAPELGRAGIVVRNTAAKRIFMAD
jgi:hypothetical protein